MYDEYDEYRQDEDSPCNEVKQYSVPLFLVVYFKPVYLVYSPQQIDLGSVIVRIDGIAGSIDCLVYFACLPLSSQFRIYIGSRFFYLQIIIV